MDWPTAAVLIAIVIAVMAVVSTYIAGAKLEEVNRANPACYSSRSRPQKECEMSESTTKYGILVAVDGSAESDAAVRWAAREAAMRDAPVTLMHVVAPVVASWPVAPLQGASPSGRRKTRSTSLNRRRRRCTPAWVKSEPPAVHTEVLHSAIVPTAGRRIQGGADDRCRQPGHGCARPRAAGLGQQRFGPPCALPGRGRPRR